MKNNKAITLIALFYFDTKSSFFVSGSNTKAAGFAKGYIKQVEGIKF